MTNQNPVVFSGGFLYATAACYGVMPASSVEFYKLQAPPGLTLAMEHLVCGMKVLAKENVSDKSCLFAGRSFW